MPYVNVKVIENVFTPEEKAQMLKGVSEAIVAVEGENLREYTMVVLEEVHSGDWAIGGQPLSTAAVQGVRSAPARASS
jgi:4-oxalocrotonate tautomerase